MDGTDWLLRETWHSYVSGNSFPLVSYWYANGRPFYYDPLNRVVATTNPLAKKQTFGCDTVSNRLIYTNELKQTTNYGYAAAGNTTTNKNPTAQAIGFLFSSADDFILISIRLNRDA